MNRRGVFAQNTYLRLQLHAGLRPHHPLHMRHQRQKIRRSAAAVQQKARVLLTDLRPADGAALQPALVNERRGIIALRALEGAARAGIIQRLLSARRRFSSAISCRSAAPSPGVSSK